jgi:hypothetical protein
LAKGRFPYDSKVFGVLAGAGTGAALFFAIVAKIFSDSWKTNEAFFFAAVLALMLSGLYTWLPVKQPDMAKLIPPALLVVFGLFVVGDFSDAYGNHESMERFWNTLPSFASICACSAAAVYLTWMPKLKAWAGKGAPPAAPAPRTRTDSGKRVIKKPGSGPKKKPTPAPARSRVAPKEDVDEERTVDEHVPVDDDGENTVEEHVPDDSGPLKRPEITTAPPKLKKR